MPIPLLPYLESPSPAPTSSLVLCGPSVDLGDFSIGSTIYHYFPSYDATGSPTALVGGSVSVYKNGSTTEVSTGLTLTASFDARTGLNLLTIDSGSDSNLYAAGSDFACVLTAGTVDGIDVSNTVLCRFSIDRESGSAKVFLDLVNGIETGVTPRQALRAIASALAGVLSGAGTTSVQIAAVGNPATSRIQATVDENGNRSALTLNLG